MLAPLLSRWQLVALVLLAVLGRPASTRGQSNVTIPTRPAVEEPLIGPAIQLLAAPRILPNKGTTDKNSTGKWLPAEDFPTEGLSAENKIKFYEIQLALVKQDSVRALRLAEQLTANMPAAADSAALALKVEQLVKQSCWTCKPKARKEAFLNRPESVPLLPVPAGMPSDPTARGKMMSERRMWYQLGALMLVKADQLRADAKSRFNQQAYQPAQLPGELTTTATATQYYREVISRRAALQGQLDLANSLDALGNFYSYYGLNLNRLVVLPVRHRQHAPEYFNSASSARAGQFLGRSTTAINPSNGKLSQYGEVYSDYIGWTKATVGLMVVSSKNDPNATADKNLQQEATQRLAAGGGNLVFALAFPLFSFHTFDDHFAVKGHLLPRFATDLPQQGQPADNFAYHSEATVEFFGYYTGYNSVISPYLSARLGKNWGNRHFFNNLQRESHDGFTLFQIDGGLSLSENVQVGVRYNSGQTFIRKAFPLSIALSLLPQIGNKK